MKRLKLALICAAIGLSGCLATTGPSPSEVSAFWEDHKARLEQARKGEIKRSDVFRQSYAKMASMPDSYDKNAFLWFFNEVVGISVRLEAGEITMPQAQDLVRSAETESRRQAAQAKAQAESIAAQQQAANAARSAASAQILQQWQANQPQRIAPINCTTQRLGTVINTQCN